MTCYRVTSMKTISILGSGVKYSKLSKRTAMAVWKQNEVELYSQDCQMLYFQMLHKIGDCSGFVAHYL